VAWGEVKRMYVAPAARGRRIGRLLDHAKGAKITVLRLETGSKQMEALSLYRSVGFRTRGPFADYPDNEASIFMEMRIA
jgi:putative acetyltransferase